MVLYIVPLVYLAWVRFCAVDFDGQLSIGVSVCAYFSAAGSVGSAVLLFGAVFLQNRELKLQREELSAAREVQKQQAAAMQEQAKYAADQARALQLQSRLEWEGTVTALVTEAIRLRQAYETGRETKTVEVPLTGLLTAAERAQKLVDDLTRRGTDQFVMPFVRDAWRDAVGLPRLGKEG